MKKNIDLVDLHMHSTFSDGTDTPSELLDAIMLANIKTFALTDHDTLNGNVVFENLIKEKKYDIDFIPGIELGTFIDYKGKRYNIHILGYNIIKASKELNNKLEFLRNQRHTRFTKMINKVNLLGYKINLTDINIPIENKSLGRPLLAQALCNYGYFQNPQSVFNNLLGEGKPGYVPQEKMSPTEAIRLIKESNGLAVLAHPAEIKDDSLVEKMLREEAFDGVEIWHPSAEKNKIRKYLQLADEFDLFVTGGSDFHGSKGRFPKKIGDFCVDCNQVSKFLNKVKSNN